MQLNIFNVVNFNEEEGGIYIPNEIFNDIQGKLSEISSHVAFAYSYYYLITYLYRFTKYRLGEGYFTQAKLKEFLGYSATNKKVDFIIKKGGVLDELGYTETITDYPIDWHSNDLNMIVFKYVRSLKSEEMQDVNKSEVNSRNFKAKKPVKAFMREGYECGTFYGVENTHYIPVYDFLQCMYDKELGINAFYLYGFLRMMYDKFPRGYKVSAPELMDLTGLKRSTLFKYMRKLEQEKFISVTSVKVGDKNFPNVYKVIR